MSDPLHPTQSLRRRAAVAVLSDQLDEPALLQSLWLQHDQMRGDAVTDIVRFIDSVAQHQGLDTGTCKRLYTEYYKALRLPDGQLPLDPWPNMQALRPAVQSAVRAAGVLAAPNGAGRMPVEAQPVQAPVQPTAATQVVINPVAVAMAAAVHAPTVASTVPGAPSVPVVPTATATAAEAEPVLLFAVVMRSIVDEVQKYHREALEELRKDSQAYLPRAQTGAALQAAFLQAWSRPLQADWRLQGSSADLAQLLRVVYQALAEAFGRVGADQILQRAIRSAEALPEARFFSPKRLLAAM